MSFISRFSWLKGKNNITDEETRDISEILRAGRSSKRRENLKFTGKTRGKSATSMFGRRQLREAILHCVVNEEER
ncbi:MAG: hypothetical protein ACJ0K4_03100 [Verrucomicrobiales bacterium]|nr:MAG: hypothetical protein EVB09_00615 [Verrucomicrobiaceae bacterium]